VIWNRSESSSSLRIEGSPENERTFVPSQPTISTTYFGALSAMCPRYHDHVCLSIAQWCTLYHGQDLSSLPGVFPLTFILRP